jgi:large subunit ribosomal protein L29
MKIHEIRELKTEELVKRIEDEEKNLVDLRFAHQLKQLTNTSKLKLTKKDLAKMKTILKERESVLSTTKEGVKV